MTNPDSAEAEFLAQAEEALEDAEILIEKERFAGSINRAYYAAFYSACALLDSVGLKSNSHQAAIALLHRDFVRSERLDRKLMQAYTRLFEARMSGDYGPFSAATAQLAQSSLETARNFSKAVQAILS